MMPSTLSTVVTLSIGCITVGVVYGIWYYSTKDTKKSSKEIEEKNEKNERESTVTNNDEIPKEKAKEKPRKLSKMTSIANLSSSFNDKEMMSLPIDLKEYLLILSNWYRCNINNIYLSKAVINIILDYSKYKIKIFNLYNPFIVDTFIERRSNDDINGNIQIIQNVDCSTKEKRIEIGWGSCCLLMTNKSIKELDPVVEIRFNFNDKIKYMNCIIGYISGDYDKKYVVDNEYKKSLLDENKSKQIGYYKLDIREDYGNYQFGHYKYSYSYRQRRGKCQTENDPIDKNEKIMTMKYKRGISDYEIQFYVKGERVFSSPGLSDYSNYYYFIQFTGATNNFSVSVINRTD